MAQGKADARGNRRWRAAPPWMALTVLAATGVSETPALPQALMRSGGVTSTELAQAAIGAADELQRSQQPQQQSAEMLGNELAAARRQLEFCASS
jgi:hypothetical protein